MFFVIWITAVAVPAVVSTMPSSYAANMLDMTGFVRPLAGPAPMAMGSFTIGFTQVLPGRVPLDTMAGVYAPGYLASRLTWAVIAVALAALAGLLYRPHLAAQKARKPGWFARLSAPPRPPGPANPAAPAAGFASSAFFNLVRAEFRLIGEGRVFIVLAGLAAALGALADYRQFGGPAAMLLLAFALSAHGGRSEAMRALTRTAALSPAVRRMAFIVAGTGWALLMALPGTVTHQSVQPLLLALVTGAGCRGDRDRPGGSQPLRLCAPPGPARHVVRLFLDRSPLSQASPRIILWRAPVTVKVTLASPTWAAPPPDLSPRR